MAKKKILLFGGTFNPIHNAHLILARTAAEQLGMNKVVIIPNGVPPHKEVATDRWQKYEMIKLAIQDEPLFDTTTYEIDKTTPSYTIETVRHYKDCLGDDIDKPYWLIGPDNLVELKDWYKIEELMEEVIFVIGGNKNMVEGMNEEGQFHGGIYMMLFRQFPIYDKMQFEAIEIPHLDIRSTDIRERRSKGLSVNYLVPDGVSRYINVNDLYIK